MTESHDTYVLWLERENDAFADACGRDLALPVPTCPGWTVLDLLAHHASFQRWVTTIVDERHLDPVAPTALAPPQQDAVGWYRSIGTRLVTALRATPGDAHVWSVTKLHTAAAWARRQASETSVHRWDAQNATGGAQPIPHAADFIDEIFEQLLPGLIAGFGNPLPRGTLGLRATDTAEEWTMTPEADAIRVDHAPGAADVTVRGTASDLLLALWGRPSDAAIVGDQDVLRRWRRAIAGS